MIVREIYMYQFDPNYIHKMKNDKLLLISTEIDKNDLFEFDGPASQILSDLLNQQRADLDQMIAFSESVGATTDDAQALWNFCLEKKIIIKATA